jgi:hypothetical protein
MHRTSTRPSPGLVIFQPSGGETVFLMIIEVVFKIAKNLIIDVPDDIPNVSSVIFPDSTIPRYFYCMILS